MGGKGVRAVAIVKTMQVRKRIGGATLGGLEALIGGGDVKVQKRCRQKSLKSCAWVKNGKGVGRPKHSHRGELPERDVKKGKSGNQSG